MTVAVELTYRGAGATAASYNQILSQMGVTPGGSHPDPDCLFHWAAEIPGGFRVTDVWRTKEEFDEFEATIPPNPMGTPHKDFYELVNFLT